MNFLRPDSLRGRTILVVGVALVLFHAASLMLYIILSASTVTLEREEQVADRIATSARLIEHARAADRPYLARELSGPRFLVSVDSQPLIETTDETAATIAELITRTLLPLGHPISAEYQGVAAQSQPGSQPGSQSGSQSGPVPEAEYEPGERSTAIQKFSGLFRIHETLLVSVDLPDSTWLNFQVSGSAWDHIFSLEAIPSLSLMALAAVLIAAWAVNKPLNSLSRFKGASEQTGVDVLNAEPIDEAGPREIREAAKAFNTMQSRVRQLLETRNHMLAAISHDFRTPLTRLRLRMESMDDEVQKTKAIRDLDEMDSMIRLTLEFARDEGAGEPRSREDLRKIIAEVIESLHLEPGRLNVDVPESLELSCQPVGLRRLLSNVIGNAAYYARAIQITAARHNSGIRIDVDDDGPGIDPAFREQVFMPFFRLEGSRNRETGGAGLGLAISRSIVQAHGGTIQLLDSPLGGLRVRTLLPAV